MEPRDNGHDEDVPLPVLQPVERPRRRRRRRLPLFKIALILGALAFLSLVLRASF